MFAEFFETEALARARLDAWAAGIRTDWSIGPVTEARRGPDSPAPHWSADSVAPVQRSQVTGPLRILRREARGEWARYGEPYRGTSRVALEVAFPVEGQQ